MGRKPAPLPIPDAWSDSVGQIPHKVTVREEPTRAWRLYLWWRRAGDTSGTNWGKESLRMSLRDDRGYFLPDVADRQAKATLAASAKYAKLYAGEVTPTTPIAPAKPRAVALTLGATEKVVIDEKRGLYRHPSRYRSEVERALKFAVTVWGTDKEWNELQRGDWTELMSARLQQLLREEHSGVGGTEHTITRLVTVQRWLKEEGKIMETVPPPKRNWKEEIAKEWRTLTKSHKPLEIRRPRYTLSELLSILKASWNVDPRLGLLANLGVGLRLGQVRKCMRSDLHHVVIDAYDVIELTVHGSEKKKGAVIELTPGQRAMLTAMLEGLYAELEARWLSHGTDYPLFPSGRMTGLESRRRVDEVAERPDRPSKRARKRPQLTSKMRLDRAVSDNWWLKRWGEAELLAKVTPVKGRKSYGGKRIVVDEAIDGELSDRGLKALGGWSSVAVPKGIYADQESRKGRREARDAKIGILGEVAIPGVHSGPPRTTDVPKNDRPGTESGTPDEGKTLETSNL